MKSYKEKLNEINRIKRLRKKVIKEMRYDILNAYRECLMHEKKYFRLFFTYIVVEDYDGILNYIPDSHPLFEKYVWGRSFLGYSYISNVNYPEIKVDSIWEL